MSELTVLVGDTVRLTLCPQIPRLKGEIGEVMAVNEYTTSGGHTYTSYTVKFRTGDTLATIKERLKKVKT